MHTGPLPPLTDFNRAELPLDIEEILDMVCPREGKLKYLPIYSFGSLDMIYSDGVLSVGGPVREAREFVQKLWDYSVERAGV